MHFSVYMIWIFRSHMVNWHISIVILFFFDHFQIFNQRFTNKYNEPATNEPISRIWDVPLWDQARVRDTREQTTTGSSSESMARFINVRVTGKMWKMSSNRTFLCSKYNLGNPDWVSPFGTDLIKVKNVRNCKTRKCKSSWTFRFVQFPRRNLYLCISAFLRLFCGTNFKNKNSWVEGLTFPTWFTNSYSKSVFYSGHQVTILIGHNLQRNSLYIIYTVLFTRPATNFW